MAPANGKGNRYFVFIQKNNNIISCSLQEKEEYEYTDILKTDYNDLSKTVLTKKRAYREVASIEFDIYNVIGDFIETMEPSQLEPEEEEHYRKINQCGDNKPIIMYKFKKGWKNHPFFLKKEIDLLHLTPYYVTDSLFGFQLTYSRLMEFLSKRRGFNLEDVENVRLYYGLTFTTKISLKDCIGDSRYYGINTRLELDTFDTFDTDIKNKDALYIYECLTMADIVFSVLHYYAMEGLKLTKCQHCGNHFATKTLKDKYCNRNSPYTGYEHLSCGVAVNRIKDKCKKSYEKIYSRLTQGNHYLCNQEQRIIVDDFHDKYIFYKNKISECASVDNLKELDAYICSNDFKLRRRRNGKHNQKDK